MRSPSTRTAGVGAVSLSLGTAAAAGLHAPEWVWIVTAIAAAVCLVIAVGLYVLVDRPAKTGRRPTGSIRAGHAIKAEGSIEAGSDIEAGWWIDAGGNIHAGGEKSQADRLALLREQHRKGRSLQKMLVRADIQESPKQASEAKKDAQYKAGKWGVGAWRVIAEHFPGYEKAFFGEGQLALGSTGFMLASLNEMRHLGLSVDSYLDNKLEFIEELLRRYDS
jgi:hypothetical protein